MRKAFLQEMKLSIWRSQNISDYIQSYPDARKEGRKDIRQLKAQKVSRTEAGLEKLSSVFMMIMKDAKKQYGEKVDDRTIGIE